MSPSPPPEAQPNASPSLLPAPPLPPSALPASPSASTLNSSSRPWPENHNGPLLLFFDPFSSRISSLKTEIQHNLSSSNRSLPTTMLAIEATHPILDPDCPQSSWVRQAARPDQHVVRFEWIEDSLLHGFSVPEGGYQMDSRGFGGAAATSSSRNEESMEVEEGRDEEEEGREMEEERSDSGPDDSSSEDEEDDVYAVKQQSRRSAVSTNASSGPRVPWSPSENEKLAQHIADSSGTSMREIFRSFSRLHPRRTAPATRHQYYLIRAWFNSKVRRLKRKGKKEHRVGGGSIAESDADSDLDARPSPLPSSSIPNQQQPVASSSPPPVAQTPSQNTTFDQPHQPVPVASSSNHQHRPFISLSNPISLSHPHHQSLARPSTPPYSDAGTPQRNRPSSPEPDVFRMVGVAPSSFPLNTRFCFFCGTTRTSNWKTIHDLVGWREVNGEKVVSSAPSRGSCNGCYTFQLKRTKEAEVPKEVWKRGEQRTLLWATEELLVRGMRMRKEVVEGR